MGKRVIYDETLSALADKVRAKTGETIGLTVDETMLMALDTLPDKTYPMADQPETMSQRLCLARAAQMRDIKYKLKADMDFTAVSLKEGITVTGLPYSSVRKTDRFIGFNVSIYTFMTAINNPRSVLYTISGEENEVENGSIASVYYGTNCSTFVSYVYDWTYHNATNIISMMPSLDEIAPSEMKLCDIADSSSTNGGSAGHVVLITGLKRDESGAIIEVEITHSWPPYIKRDTMSYDVFLTDYIDKQGYKVYRNTSLHECGYKPIPFVKGFSDESEPSFVYSKLCTNRGDKVSITTDESITLNVLLDSGYESIKLLKDGELYGEYTVSNNDIVNGDVELLNLPTGLYTATLYDSNGTQIDNSSAFFEVCSATVTQSGTTFTFSGDKCTPVRIVYKDGMGYTIDVFDLSNDDIAKGNRTILPIECISNEIPAQVCVPFKTTYGYIVARCEYNDIVHDIFEIPTDYQQVEYIESDGKAYINTVVMASDYPDGIAYSWTGAIKGWTEDASLCYLWGCLKDSKRSGNVAFVNIISTLQAQLYLGGESISKYTATISDIYNRASLTFDIFANSSDPSTLSATYNKGYPWSVNGNSYKASDMPDGEIYLGWCNGVGSASKPAKAQYMNFKMSDADGNIIAHFVPCIRKNDNTVGMYDIVRDRFFTNSGEGNFTAGPEIVA